MWFDHLCLMVAVGVGTGVGINALLSHSLGSGDRQKASRIAGNAIFLGLCTYIVFFLFGLFGIEAYLKSQTGDPVMIAMAREYLDICILASFGCILFMIYEKLLQATGRTGLSTIAQVIGAVVNIILDPVMIFGLFGLPAMGIKGAAWATVIGQVLALAASAFFHHRYNKDLDHGLSYFKPSRAIITEIYVIGIPAILMQALMSFMTYGVNIIFGRVSTTAVTAYGVYYKIQQFVFFAAFGMNNALIPIIAFNYGMKDAARLKQAIRYGMIYIIVLMLLGTAGLQLFAQPLAGIFSLNEETMAMCVRAIRVITLGYLFSGANITFQGIFQALGSGVRSLIVSLLRLVVVTLPLAFFFTTLPGAASLIWWAFPVAEATAFFVALAFMLKISHEKVSKVERSVLKHA